MFSNTCVSPRADKINLLSLILWTGIFLISEIHAHEVYQKIYDTAGNDLGQNIHRTLDNGYIIGGVYNYEYSSVYYPFLLKLESDGSVDWCKVYGEFECDYVSYTQVCDDGSFALTGQYHNQNTGNLDIFLIKVDYSGEVVQSFTYDYPGDQVVRTFRKIPSGGFLLGGRWTDEAFLMKMDQNFNPVWINILGGYTTEVIYACQVGSDTAIVAAGYTRSYGMGDADILLVKLNMNGQIIWAEAIGSSFKEAITGDKALTLTRDGGAVLAGYIDRYDENESDVLLVKVDETGQLEWTGSYGGMNAEIGWMPEETADSGYVAASYSASFTPPYNDGYLIKTDAYGTLQWSKIYGGSNEERMMCILQDSLNTIIFCGWTTSFGARQGAIYVVKTDSNGYSGGADRSVESITAEPELVVTPIADLQLELMYASLSEFQVSASSIAAGDITIYNISADRVDPNENTYPISNSFNLYQNYPNPFNPATTIDYRLAKNSRVTLKICDINGREIRSLILNEFKTAGDYKIEWDGKDNQGLSVASGTYFYQIETEEFVKARKMIIIK